MTAPAPRVRARPMCDDDRAFVVSTWASSLRDEFSAGILHREDWHPIIRSTIGRIIDESGLRTLVIYDRDGEEGNLLGFVCGRPGYVAYCYVVHKMRRFGLGRFLLEQLGQSAAAPFEYGCRTRAVVEIVSAGKLPVARWNPVPLRTYERKPKDEQRQEQRQERAGAGAGTGADGRREDRARG